VSALLTGLVVHLAAFAAAAWRVGGRARLSRWRFLLAAASLMFFSSPLLARIVARLSAKIEAGVDQSGAAFLFFWVLTASVLGALLGAACRMRANDAGLSPFAALIGLVPPLGLALALPAGGPRKRAASDAGD
jgi:hypothetical protein